MNHNVKQAPHECDILRTRYCKVSSFENDKLTNCRAPRYICAYTVADLNIRVGASSGGPYTPSDSSSENIPSVLAEGVLAGINEELCASGFSGEIVYKGDHTYKLVGVESEDFECVDTACILFKKHVLEAYANQVESETHIWWGWSAIASDKYSPACIRLGMTRDEETIISLQRILGSVRFVSNGYCTKDEIVVSAWVYLDDLIEEETLTPATKSELRFAGYNFKHCRECSNEVVSLM